LEATSVEVELERKKKRERWREMERDGERWRHTLGIVNLLDPTVPTGHLMI